MKKIIFCFLLCISGQIFADGACTEKLSKVEASMGEHQAYSTYADILRAQINEKEELNDSFFGDFLVNDSNLRASIEVAQAMDSLVSLKEAVLDANIGMYKSCMLLEHGTYLSDEELISDVDNYEVMLVKRESLMRILESL